MIRQIRPIALLFALVALAAVPAVSQADHGKHKGKGKSTNHCTIKRGFTLRGTLKTFTPDDPTTGDDEESISIEVTRANKHARRAGWDNGDTFTTDSDDSFKYKLVGYEGTDTPSEGDKVKLVGKISYTKKRCAPETSLENRYGDPNIRKAVIKDSDPD